MPVFREPTGAFARFIAQENRREAETAPVEPSEPAAAPAPEPTNDPARPVLRNSERDPKWYARLHQLEERCEEIWPGRGLWQIQMGSNLWPRLANASGKTSDEIWEYALDRLAEIPAIPRAICTYLAAMLEQEALRAVGAVDAVGSGGAGGGVQRLDLRMRRPAFATRCT